MAENKKSFLMYADQKGLFDKLPDELAGKLIKLIYSYVNDENPQVEDFILSIAFEPIKAQLKRDLKGWDGKRNKRSDNGRRGNLKRWHPDLWERVDAEEITVEEAESIAKHRNAINENSDIANIAVNVNDNVTVTVNDTVNVTDIESVYTPAPEIKSVYGKMPGPKVPNREDVQRKFLQSGGTMEMANAFFDKYDALGWYKNGAAIVNWASLVSSFIQNWREIEAKKPKKTTENDWEQWKKQNNIA